MSGLKHEDGVSIHLEPTEPIMLEKMLESLKGLQNEYSDYAKTVWNVPSGNKTRLYVGSVKPGSIDILLQPDIIETTKIGLAVATSAGPLELTTALLDFGKHVGGFLHRFQSLPDPETVSIRDCDNAANIVSLIVESGGSMTVNVVENATFTQQFFIDDNLAARIAQNAKATKEQLLLPTEEKRSGVAMIWKTVDRSPGQTQGMRTPDKGMIEAIDDKPHSITFNAEDDTKSKVLSGSENPMTMILYVDVTIIRVDGKIRAYRIDSLQGMEPLDELE